MMIVSVITIDGLLGLGNSIILSPPLRAFRGASDFVVGAATALVCLQLYRVMGRRRQTAELGGSHDALLKSEERYRLLVEGVEDYAIFALDTEAFVVGWNNGAKRIKQYEAHEIIGKHFSKFYPTEELAANRPAKQLEIAAREGSVKTEGWRIRKDGTRFIAHVVITAIRDNQGKLQGFTKITRDITERKIAEESLQRAHDELNKRMEDRSAELNYQNQLTRTIADNTASCLFLLDREGRATFMNPAAEITTGFSLEEIKDRPFHELVRSNQPFFDKNQSEGVLFQEQEDTFTKKSGIAFPVSFSIAPLFRNGRLEGGILEFRDITAQKIAADALKRSEADFRKLTEALPQLVWTASPTGQFLYCNDRWWQFTGFDFDEPRLLQKWLERVHPDDRADRAAHWETALRAGTAFEAEYRVFDRSIGEHRWLLARAVPLRDDEGKITKWIGSHTDIDGQRKAEAERASASARAQAAIEASQMKSEFLAKMSHEIRTPLNCILGMNEVLNDTPLDSEQKKIVLLSKRAGANLLHLVNDVLDLAKVEAGKITLDPKPFNLRETVEQCIGMLSFRASKKGIALTATIANTLPSWFIGDSSRIQQILLNLISNAIKFTAQGKVEVQVTFSRPSPSAHDYWVTLSIEDTGMGIPDHLQAQLFEKFNQLDPSVASAYGGTGLGLSISRQLAELMKGKVEFKTREGFGSTFSLILPLTSTSASECIEAVTQTEKEPPLSILIVDDVEDNRTLIELYLKDRGHKLHFAGNGKQAIEWVKTQPIQLILMDINMPDIDGFETARHIRALEKERALPPSKIIALTAYALEMDARKSLDAGCDGHAPKPITKDILLKLLT